jgi:hypothetical protein
MDVGIVPEAGDFQMIPPQNVNALVGAGGAADMKQGFHKTSENANILTIISPKKETCKGGSHRYIG